MIIWAKQISKEKNPEMACKIPAACLLALSEPNPSAIPLIKKKPKAVRHWSIYNILFSIPNSISIGIS